ncbi:MAG TPA: universal stress protein [Noviherbaspirillum sp.]|nr:universal stress protein [Noviherbaspirillum sp.]
MKILIAVDGSSYSSKAVKHVVKHFDWLQGKPELHVLHVTFPIPLGRARAFMQKESINDYYRKEAEVALAPAEKILCKAGIPYVASFKAGDIASEIDAYIRKNKIDMIVMGSHGHGALQNVLMGSVTTKVLATTKIPALIIR